MGTPKSGWECPSASRISRPCDLGKFEICKYYLLFFVSSNLEPALSLPSTTPYVMLGELSSHSFTRSADMNIHLHSPLAGYLGKCLPTLLSFKV